MLGIKSNRGPITGKFADILRDEIAAALKEREQNIGKVATKEV